MNLWEHLYSELIYELKQGINLKREELDTLTNEMIEQFKNRSDT